MQSLITSLEPVIIVGAVLYGIEQAGQIVFPGAFQKVMKVPYHQYDFRTLALIWLCGLWVITIMNGL